MCTILKKTGCVDGL